jgi:FlaA1/EpsC-like NDP-sugar epimerase
MGEPIRIVELARHVITLSGRVPELEVPITYTGLRPGEKLHEELLADGEERLRSVDSRILVADCPPPRADLDEWVDALLAAAAARRAGEVIDLLRVLVPGYRPSGESMTCSIVPPAGLAAACARSGGAVHAGH